MLEVGGLFLNIFKREKKKGFFQFLTKSTLCLQNETHKPIYEADSAGSRNYPFNTKTQCSTKLIDQFVTDLKNIANDCEFGDIKNDLIRDRIVCGTNSENVN